MHQFIMIIRKQGNIYGILEKTINTLYSNSLFCLYKALPNARIQNHKSSGIFLLSFVCMCVLNKHSKSVFLIGNEIVRINTYIQEYKVNLK